MPQGKEMEIKMRLDPRRIEALELSKLLKDAARHQKQFRTVYFDDRRHRLARKGFELRVRSEGQRHVQTVKSVGGVVRGEWETEVSAFEPSPAGLSKTPAGKIVKNGARLRPVFALQINRRIWTLSRGDATLEVALDDGSLEAGDERRPICEVELELKNGSEQQLYEVAAEVSAAAQAPISFVSKGGKGYRLACGDADEPEHSLDLRLERKDSVETAFKTIADACLRQFSINEERLQAGIEVEAVHQARVAIRRLRAVFSLFGKVVRGDDVDAVRAGLKWISDLLGAARDLDVFSQTRMSEVMLEHPGVPGLEELSRRIETKRHAAHNRLREAISSQRFRQLMLDVAHCVHDGAWIRDAEAAARDEPLLKIAKAELQRRFDAVLRKGKSVRGHDALKRHRVRIKAKRLRYMGEFLKPLAAGAAYAKTVKQLEKLQDLLGALNDEIAGERLLGQLAEEARRPTVTFAADLVRRSASSAQGLLKKAEKAHRRLREEEPFWAHI